VIETVNEEIFERRRRITGKFFLCVSSALLVLVVSPTSGEAAPITVDFSTTGAFSGCDALGSGAGFVTCTEGNAILRYNFAAPGSALLTDALPSASVQYGSFQMTGATLSTFSGVTFTLTLLQTSPILGSQALVGAISGSVDAPNGLLIWGPVAPESWDIGSIHWTIALDENGPATGGFLINPPGAGGATSPAQTIGGTASMVPTAVPEPSTVALMGIGLAALSRISRRRRRKPTE